MAQKITCPRRMEDVGPWEWEHYLDKWCSNTWKPGKQIPASSTFENGKQVVTSWQIGWESSWPEPPITCSFCGSARWEDVERLLKEGWEIEVAKSYKAYLNPPGYSEYMYNLRAIKYKKPGKFNTPTPPVKVYMQHLNREQVDALNDILSNVMGSC